MEFACNASGSGIEKENSVTQVVADEKKNAVKYVEVERAQSGVGRGACCILFCSPINDDLGRPN